MLVNTARLMRELGFAKGSVSIIKSVSDSCLLLNFVNVTFVVSVSVLVPSPNIDAFSCFDSLKKEQNRYMAVPCQTRTNC